MAKIKLVSGNYVQLFDDLKPLGGDVDLSGVIAQPLPRSVSNIDDVERERLRRLAQP